MSLVKRHVISHNTFPLSIVMSSVKRHIISYDSCQKEVMSSVKSHVISHNPCQKSCHLSSVMPSVITRVNCQKSCHLSSVMPSVITFVNCQKPWHLSSPVAHCNWQFHTMMLCHTLECWIFTVPRPTQAPTRYICEDPVAIGYNGMCYRFNTPKTGKGWHHASAECIRVSL